MRIPRKVKGKVKVNTTALPDIIFMLLFFFMVTTVIQEASVSEMIMAEAYNDTAISEGNEEILEVFIKRVEKDAVIKVNDELPVHFRHYDQVLKNKIKELRNRGVFLNGANLYIDASSEMRFVNKVKAILQEENILNLKYVHKLERQ